MTFDEQDSLIESLNAAYDKAGTITDEDIKELFAKKNAIADEDEQTSYEFDEFFAEVVSKWAQDGLTGVDISEILKDKFPDYFE